MLLVSQPSYITVAQFRAMPNDRDLTSYSDLEMQDILNRASGAANAIMHRSLLAREDTIRYYGDGTNKLELRERPILYIKRIQILVPGTNGYAIPANQFLIDFAAGDVMEYTPLLLQGYGFFAAFPRDVPIDITLARGYGSVVVAPAWTASDFSGSGIPAGPVNIAVTAKTMWGETTAAVRQYTTTTGNVTVSVKSKLGAYSYRVYASDATENTTLSAAVVAGSSTMSVSAAAVATVGAELLIDSGANAEIVTVASVVGTTVTATTALQYAHAIGAPVILLPSIVAETPQASTSTTSVVSFSSFTPPADFYADTLPVVDTSAPQLPYGVTEGVRLLTLSMIFEQNNLANMGVYRTQTGGEGVMWKSTEGNSGRGTPTLVEQAMNYLKPYALQAIF